MDDVDIVPPPEDDTRRAAGRPGPLARAVQTFFIGLFLVAVLLCIVFMVIASQNG